MSSCQGFICPIYKVALFCVGFLLLFLHLSNQVILQPARMSAWVIKTDRLGNFISNSESAAHQQRDSEQ